MSNTTITVNEAAEAAQLADIRRAEEEERRARIERERSVTASGEILQQEARYRGIQNRLDAASMRLPDLVYTGTFHWPDAPPQQAGAAQLEAYLSQLRQQLDRFESDAASAVSQAEHRLMRRQATAAAWRTSHDIEAQWRQNQQALTELAQRLGQQPRTEAHPQRPAQDAELEQVQTHVARLQTAVSRQEATLTALRSEARTLARASENAGGAVTGTRSGAQALVEHQAKADAQALARFEASLQQAMAASAVRSEDLPPVVMRLVDGARQMATDKDWSVTLTDWMAHQAARRRDTARALMMLSSPPEGALEDSALTQRWQQLTPRLQAAMAGHETLSSDIEAEFAQLGRDAQRQLNYRLSRAACFARLAREGMQVVERDDGEGLVVIDLSCPETWLEVQEFEGENGEFAATFVLKTDAAEGSLNEEAQTASVCERLGKANGQGTDKVRSESEVVERKRRITRAIKPVLKSRAMTF